MDPPPLTLEQLRQAVGNAEPAALLVPSRLIRRVIKHDRHVPGLGLQVPHRNVYVVDRDKLLTVVEPAELGCAAAHEVPDHAVLLEQPDADELESTSAEELLAEYWRRLFHARLHRELQANHADFEENSIEEKIQQLGVVAYEEARAVLAQEGMLFTPSRPRDVLEELSVVHGELGSFAPETLAIVFPALVGRDDVKTLLAGDLDLDELRRATRPSGAQDAREADAGNGDTTTPPSDVEPAGKEERDKRLADILARRAERSSELGNVVRAAIWRTRAARMCYQTRGARLREAAEGDLHQLVDRLREALHLDEEAQAWREVLPLVLPAAARGIWPVEARLLYDLQKVCIDHEREVHALDPLGWLFTLGRRPLERPLPGQREVLMLKHLLSARGRIGKCRVDHDVREELARLLDGVIAASESAMRKHFHPILLEALEHAGLQPANVPEQLARDKMIEEMLDRIVERGFLNMSDVRDAVSRNQLKLDDLSSPVELLTGDALLRTNAALARAIEGVYRKGEVYLRFQQRASASLFGTRVGRFFTRFLFLPFGAAFMILEGTRLMLHEAVDILGGAVEAVPQFSASHFVFVLGVFLLAVIHLPAFRQALRRGFLMLFDSLRWFFVDLPRALYRLPPVRLVLGSAPMRWCWRFLLKPLLLAVPLTGLVSLTGTPPAETLAAGLLLLLAASATLNTRLGRDLEETTSDWLVQSWHYVRTNIFVGLFWLIMDVFRRFVEWCERGLYTVDEWLRFRTGESGVSLAFKAVLGVFWGVVIYVVRIFINLFVEPTFNPIKHFPVVTVAAKMLLPLLPYLLSYITHVLEPFVGTAIAASIATLVLFFLPGLAGYLVWELKENWKLYEANRPAHLRAVVIGHHGETMTRLLRPGIHSGTVPKTFAKMRKARRDHKRFDKQVENLHHVEASIRHFIERELIGLLRHSKGVKPLRIELAELHLSTDAVRVALADQENRRGQLCFSIAELAGHVVALMLDRSLLEQATPEQQQAIGAALTGFYKLAAVDFIWDEVTEAVPGPTLGVLDRLNHLQRDDDSLPRLGQRAVTWERWVEVWEIDQSGKPVPDPLRQGEPGV